MKKSVVGFGLLALVVSAWFVPQVLGETQTVSWQYRLTVSVETPEGIKTGSAVRQISNSIQPIDLPDAGNAGRNSGEAVVVDLGERGTLFVLISDLSDDEFYSAIPAPGHGGTTPAGLDYYGRLEPGVTGEVKARPPKMVMFKDMNDARSVELVYGEVAEKDDTHNRYDRKLVDRFQELFGDGVKLKSITIETTNDPRTSTDILSTIPTFDDRFWEWRRQLDFSDPRKINEANFSRGEIR